MRRSLRLLNVPAIKDIATYESIKTSTAPMMVGYYTGHFSAASKLYAEQFEAMAKAYPRYSFYTCDVDDVPLAAYDAEVEEVPSIVILPLGLKPNGASYDKTEMAAFNEVIGRAKAAVDGITVVDDEAERAPWQ